MLAIYTDALAIVRTLVPVVEAIRRKQPSLADQLDRAADSTVLGIAEGSRSVGKSRALHYSRGAASMDEAIACVDLALAKGHIAAFDQATRERMRKVVGTLIKARQA